MGSYVSHNGVSHAELFQLIGSVHAALRSLGKDPTVETKPLMPAVPIKKSVTSDWIVCLENGKKFKSMRQHLRSS